MIRPRLETDHSLIECVCVCIGRINETKTKKMKNPVQNIQKK